MSIATLKRKSFTQYNNMSVGQKQFSLNGTHRLQGFVGQNILSRNLQKTPMKHSGGCCGSYPIGHTVLNGLTSTEDTTKVKVSTMNTSGLIETKYNYKWVKRPYPCSIVKPDTTLNSNTQGSYIELKANDCPTDKKSTLSVNCNAISNKLDCSTTKDITNDPHIVNKVAADQSMYIFRKKQVCNKLNDLMIPHNWNGGPILNNVTSGGSIPIDLLDFMVPGNSIIDFSEIGGMRLQLLDPIHHTQIQDDGYENIGTIGFPFKWFGIDYGTNSSVYFDTNLALTFGSGIADSGLIHPYQLVGLAFGIADRYTLWATQFPPTLNKTHYIKKILINDTKSWTDRNSDIQIQIRLIRNKRYQYIELVMKKWNSPSLISNGVNIGNGLWTISDGTTFYNIFPSSPPIGTGESLVIRGDLDGNNWTVFNNHYLDV